MKKKQLFIAYLTYFSNFSLTRVVIETVQASWLKFESPKEEKFFNKFFLAMMEIEKRQNWIE